MTLPYPKIKLALLGLVVIIVGFSLSGRQNNNVNGNNASSKDVLTSLLKNDGTLTANTAGVTPQGNDNIDSAKGLFINRQDAPAQAKKISDYIDAANNAIPLETEAISFALIESSLGNNDPLRDVIGRLLEGQSALTAITPPLEALTFHKMSIALLGEYQKILNVPLIIPRDQFDPKKLEDTFKRLDFLVSLAKHELNVLHLTYSLSLYPKAITFYDEAIGLRAH